jgi:uncharacterized membrane protein
VRLVILWVHVVSAVIWIGGLAWQSHVLLPLARRGEVATFAEAARHARPVTWTAIGLVVLTGFYNITQLGPMEQVMQSGAGQMVVGKFILVIAMAAIMGQRDFARLTLLRGALASGGDPQVDLRAITRMDRVILLLALIVIYLGLAISRA